MNSLQDPFETTKMNIRHEKEFLLLIFFIIGINALAFMAYLPLLIGGD